MAQKRIFKEIPKNSIEKIVISESEWNDNSYLDMRIFYDASDGKGTDFRPTKKGITIRLNFLKDFKEGIDKAYKELINEA